MTARHLDFRVEVLEESSPDWPSVTILADGEDVIGRATRFQGFDPEDIFGRGAPLLPQDPPRRVAVYRCSCGEQGCGCAACLITQEGDVVRWTDFRDYTGVYARPLVKESPDGGTKQPVPDLEIDATQYHEAVQRASEDRGWETRRRRRARLLRDELLSVQPHFEAMGYTIGWVAPEWNDENGVQVEVRAPNGQVVLRLDADPDDSEEESARKMSTWLVSTPERRWNVQHRNTWPRP